MQKGPTRFLSDFGFYICAALLAIASWEFQGHIWATSQLPPGTILGQEIPFADMIKQQLDAYLEVNRLLTTLATTVLGALGIVLFRGGTGLTSTRRLWAAMLGALLVAVSIFFGYVAYGFAMATLQTGSVSFGDPSSAPLVAQRVHFYTFLTGIIFLADFVLHNLKKEV